MKYERFIRPMALRYKKAHVTHPEVCAVLEPSEAFLLIFVLIAQRHGALAYTVSLSVCPGLANILM